MTQNKAPRYPELIQPTYKALLTLRGSGSNEEITETVINQLQLTDEQINQSHLGSTTQTELEYELAWARTYLKNYGIIERTKQGIWALTTPYLKEKDIDPKEIIRYTANKKHRATTAINDNEQVPELDDTDYPEENRLWRKRLEKIIKNMDPYGFESLCQMLLKACGFENVEVTKKSGDGGIDGTGRLKINGIVSLNVVFQCKRYGDNTKVSADEIRDFRGSITSNYEKFIFITTSTFTRQARETANMAGATHIDLIDGEELITMLAENEIGLHRVETYDIDEEFFKNLS